MIVISHVNTVFQPVILAGMVMNITSLGFAGAITAGVLRLYLIGLPAMVAGLWAGFKLYGGLDDAGVGLIVPLL